MKIVAISDLHGYLPEDIEPCELVLICGDISPLKIQGFNTLMREWIIEIFKPWCESLPCDKVIFIAGNHDFYLNSNHNFIKEQFSNDDKVTYLCNESYIYTSKEGKNYNIFGSPYCKVFGNWAFMRNDEILTELFSEIPENLDILITHDTPYGYSDICLEAPWTNYEHIGNIPLRDAILEKSPAVSLSGHLHSASHEWIRIGNTKHINCSIKNEQYEPVYDYIVFDL